MSIREDGHSFSFIQMKKIQFDIMLDGRFVCTMRPPLTLDLIDRFDGDEPVVSLEAIQRYVEQKRPSLKGKDYRICF